MVAGEIFTPAEDTPSIFTLAAAGSVVTIGSTFLAFEPDPRAMAPILVERGKRFVPGLKEDVETYSEGEEPARFLVIAPLAGA